MVDGECTMSELILLNYFNRLACILGQSQHYIFNRENVKSYIYFPRWGGINSTNLGKALAYSHGNTWCFD